MRNSKAEQIRQLSESIDNFRQLLQDRIKNESLTVDEQVQIGTQLWKLAKRTNAALDDLKSSLRAEAVEQCAGPGTQHINAQDGSCCSITIPKPSPAVKKDADIEGVKQVLKDRFDSLFETVVTYKPRREFEKRTASCSPEQMNVLLDVLEMKEHTPRVSFKDSK